MHVSYNKTNLRVLEHVNKALTKNDNANSHLIWPSKITATLHSACMLGELQNYLETFYTFLPLRWTSGMPATQAHLHGHTS